MNLAIDYGNSRIKVASFELNNLVLHKTFLTDAEFQVWLKDQFFENVIVSSVTRSTEELLSTITCSGKKLMMSQTIPLPIQIQYATPHTLGVDRIAAACGVLDILPNQHCLIVDLGTCINYEFIDDHATYKGGAISPGVKMRYQAMHTFTARLPLVHSVDSAPLTGDSTAACIQSGVVNGMAAEIEGIITRYREKYPTVGVILCGGDAMLFENKLKQPIFVAPNLVLSGLNRILLHNVNL